jgi:uncharacterized 2Fe-2S/4Fe-4S cluster protein (DUF4445 family)
LRSLVQIRREPGKRLADRLFELGVEYPCGGENACGGCRIRVVSGLIPVTREMRQALTEQELAAGWRLACVSETEGDVTVEIEQWTLRVLTDEQSVPFEPRPGLGVVIDLGTTTLVAQLVDLATGEVLGVETALNPQARRGADVMSRIQHELKSPGELKELIRKELGRMLARLASGQVIEEVLLAGNTAMHHLFCGLSVEPLAAVPFLSPHLGAVQFTSRELGWATEVKGAVRFLPCLGGFVGSDLLAGIVATGLHAQKTPHALFDIGTNGEIVLGCDGRIFCASTAAGPAFEGGRISIGMRAGEGAIDAVHSQGGEMRCHVLGGAEPRGICGSGLVDAAACGVEQGLVLASGRLAAGKLLPLSSSLALTQGDIRELQLAKGAMAAGLKLLHAQHEAPRLASLYLAGAFGNYIKQASAKAIGLLPEDVPIEPVGNSALRGARMLLLGPSNRDALLSRLCSTTTHVELASSASFQDVFAESMALAPYRLS